MIELFTSDQAIVIFAGFGLVATGVSMLRDARTQKRAAQVPQLAAVTEEVADVEVAA